MKLIPQIVACAIIGIILNAPDASGISVEERLAKLENDIAALTRLHEADVRTLRSEIEKRDDTMQEMSSQMTQLTQSVFSKEGQLRNRRQFGDVEIAFFAKIGVNVDHLGMDQVVVFDEVVTDIDTTNSLGSYNNSSGIFTTPVDGLYVFSVTMHSLNHDTTHFAIYKNIDKLTTIYIHGGELATSDSTSQTVVLSMKYGDTLSVHHIESNHGAYGGGHSLFSGFLLQLHDGEPGVSVVG